MCGDTGIGQALNPRVPVLVSLRHGVRSCDPRLMAERPSASASPAFLVYLLFLELIFLLQDDYTVTYLALRALKWGQ